MGAIIHITDEDNNPVSHDRIKVEFFERSDNNIELNIMIDSVNDTLFTEEDLSLINHLLTVAIGEGTYPSKMRGYMNLYDKISNIFERKRDK